MPRWIRWYLLATASIVGCAPAPISTVLTDRDPQNPAAGESPVPTPDMTLVLFPASRPSTDPVDPSIDAVTRPSDRSGR